MARVIGAVMLKITRKKNLMILVGILLLFWGLGYVSNLSIKTNPKRKDLKCLYINGYEDCYYFINAEILSKTLKDYRIELTRVKRGLDWTNFRNSLKKVKF